MVKKIFVGNLPFSASEEKVTSAFSKHGTVHSVRLITDPYTGRVKGFGFVEMEQNEADAAIKALNGADFDYRTLRVHEAIERSRQRRSKTRIRSERRRRYAH